MLGDPVSLIPWQIVVDDNGWSRISAEGFQRLGSALSWMDDCAAILDLNLNWIP